MSPSKQPLSADASRWDQRYQEGADGWLLGLFWCHRQPGGPPWGSDPELVDAQLRQAGLVPEIWEPATGSVDKRNDEWLGLWRQPVPTPSLVEIESC
ncbi:hypothetical protein [Synechococcus sp. MW101C3]|jgi:methyl halide transferase|uniref:hypothetical protein n=1 Tax=Synechococcus sp. MW101C3 TaxID=210768 RepID=UPI0018E964E0|nr:hypothetical protein [Synechococcus sp. MW101C3]